MGSRVRGPIVFGWSLLLQPKLSHKKIIIFIRRIIFICPIPLRKYYSVAIYCLVISDLFFEEEFLIPQEDSIDSYHHSEESPVNSTINPPIKNNLNLSPISESVWIIENIPIDPIIPDYN